MTQLNLFGRYQFDRWIHGLDWEQALHWVQTHLPSRFNGSISENQVTLAQLRDQIRGQWVELVMVLADRTLSLVVRPDQTFGDIKQLVIQQGRSPRTPQHPEEFVLQNFQDGRDWLRPESVVYPEREPVGNWCGPMPNYSYVWCRRVISDREQRALVRDRVRDFQQHLAEIQETASQQLGVPVTEPSVVELVAQWRQECHRPPDGGDIIDSTLVGQ